MSVEAQLGNYPRLDRYEGTAEEGAEYARIGMLLYNLGIPRDSFEGTRLLSLTGLRIQNGRPRYDAFIEAFSQALSGKAKNSELDTEHLPQPVDFWNNKAQPRAINFAVPQMTPGAKASLSIENGNINGIKTARFTLMYNDRSLIFYKQFPKDNQKAVALPTRESFMLDRVFFVMTFIGPDEKQTGPSDLLTRRGFKPYTLPPEIIW